MVSLFVINRLQQVKLEQVERRVENKKFSFSFMLGWFWDLLSKLSWKFSDKPPPYESHSVLSLQIKAQILSREYTSISSTIK